MVIGSAAGTTRTVVDDLRAGGVQRGRVYLALAYTGLRVEIYRSNLDIPAGTAPDWGT